MQKSSRTINPEQRQVPESDGRTVKDERYSVGRPQNKDSLVFPHWYSPTQWYPSSRPSGMPLNTRRSKLHDFDNVTLNINLK